MDDLSRVNVLESAKKLVQKRFTVLLSQWLLTPNNLRQVCVHQFSHNINVLKVASRLRQNDSFNIDDVIVLQQSQQAKLSEDPFGEYFVLEYFIYFFNGQ